MAEAPKSVLIELILPNTQEKMGVGITPHPIFLSSSMISSCVSSLCAVIAFKECNFFRIIFDCPPGDLTPADFLVRRFPPVIPRRKDLESGGYVP